MAFNPNSTIYLCCVPFDSSYKNVIYFDKGDTGGQLEYFDRHVQRTLTEYLTVRKTLPNGSLQSSVKVDINIDELQNLGVNYMFYKNANHGERIYYAFITKLIYVNEGTTEIVFETDVYQTWLHEVDILASFVVREHSETDEIGDNVIPEKFNFNDYVYDLACNYDELDEWGYLIATTERLGTDDKRGAIHTGIYQGLFFYYYEEETEINSFLDDIEEDGGDCVVFIAVVPKFNAIDPDSSGAENFKGHIKSSYTPNSAKITITYDLDKYTFDGYVPKNMKLYTAPFFKLIVTNHGGEQAEYNVEDFRSVHTDNGEEIYFKMYGDVSANPSLTLIPQDYKGINNNYDCGISICGFPQCSFNSDTFKLWLAKNQYGVGLDMIGNGVSAVAGLGLMATGAGAMAGGSMLVNGAMGMLNTMNTVYQASKEPNKLHSGSAKNNLLTALQLNRFDFYWQKLKYDYARMVDEYFTKYGYQTNAIKKPNLSSRPYFNYVETMDIDIKGRIPTEDMMKLKSIYDGGVTLWKPDAVIGNYELDNTP